MFLFSPLGYLIHEASLAPEFISSKSGTHSLTSLAVEVTVTGKLEASIFDENFNLIETFPIMGMAILANHRK